jgi:hypothetical protein
MRDSTKRDAEAELKDDKKLVVESKPASTDKELGVNWMQIRLAAIKELFHTTR